LKAYRKNNGKSCPGEKVCTSDALIGQIAGLHGKTEGRTLQNFCHKELPTKENNLKQGCPFYDTKPENVPESLLGAIETAELLRKYKTRGCLPPIEDLTAWEFCCYDVAEDASDAVQNEAANADSGNTESVVGKETPMGEFGKEKIGGAFSHWGKEINGERQ
jgi:hypothetical protein